MIKLADAYKEIEADGQKFLDLNFTCDNCKRPINQFIFDLSVFLYGVVLLTGKEFSCVGITCPTCLNTILMKEDALIESIRQDITPFFGPNGSYQYQSFRYYSPVNNMPVKTEPLIPFKLLNWVCPLTDNSREHFSSLLVQHLEEDQSLEQDYICSYISDGNPPIGSVASVWWYKPEHIEKIVQIENEKQIHIFPRYVHKMEWYQRYDDFCWRYKFYQDYLEGLKNSMSENLIFLRDYARHENINLDKLYEDSPDILNNGHVKFLEQQVQQKTVNDIYVVSDFLDLLINFDPVPWDIPGPVSDFYQDLWKSVKPFKKHPAPGNIDEFSKKQYKPIITGDEVKEMTDKVRTNITSSHVQSWAMDNYQAFIKEYAELARKADFSYGYVWDLKCRYLKGLYAVFDKVFINEAEYAFFAEGPSWTIIFNGKSLRGLKGSGFSYIQYLVKNQGIEYKTVRLDLIDGAHEKDSFSQVEFMGDNIDVGNKDMITDSMEKGCHEINDEKATRQYKDRLKELEKLIAIAEEENDMALSEQATNERNVILSHWKKGFSINKKPRHFHNNSDRIKDKIAQAIRRAVSKIDKCDPEIGNHFKNALRSINSYKQCYNPDKEINWQFKE